MNRFRPSFEALEPRETPSAAVSGRITGVVVDPADGFSGTGAYESTDAGRTWAVAPDSGTAAADPLPVLPVIADRDSAHDDIVVDGKVITAEDGAALRHRFFAVVDRTRLGGTAGIGIDTPGPVPAAGGSARFFNGIVSRASAGGANETITIGGARTETADSVRPTVLLQRLANPAAAGTTAGDDSAVVFVGGWGSTGI